MILLMFLPITSDARHPLTFHLIDVGQGDSMLLEMPNQKTILIDGGPPEAAMDLLTYLKKQNVSQIDLLVVTHPHIDHIGGLLPVMKKFPVQQIIDSGKIHSTKTYQEYIKYIIDENIPIIFAKQDQFIAIDPEVSMQILNIPEPNKTINESSLALHVEYEDVNLLLLADINQEQEKELVKKHHLSADIVKIAHHGSQTSTAMKFLQEVQPDVALISYALDNEFDHPHQQVIDRLLKLNTKIYSTALHGNIVIFIDGQQFTVNTDKKLGLETY